MSATSSGFEDLGFLATAAGVRGFGLIAGLAEVLVVVDGGEGFFAGSVASVTGLLVALTGVAGGGDGFGSGIGTAIGSSVGIAIGSGVGDVSGVFSAGAGDASGGGAGGRVGFSTVSGDGATGLAGTSTEEAGGGDSCGGGGVLTGGATGGSVGAGDVGGVIGVTVFDFPPGNRTSVRHSGHFSSLPARLSGRRICSPQVGHCTWIDIIDDPGAGMQEAGGTGG